MTNKLCSEISRISICMPSAIDWSLATQNIDIDLSFKTFLQLFKKKQPKERKKRKTNL